MPYQALADAVLLLHLGVVVFIVFGLPVIFLGNLMKWAWVNHFWLRLAHLTAIMTVVIQAWLGQYCGLTVIESVLREQSGKATYQSSFIQHWVQRFLYFDVPLWVFGLAYTCFAALVVWAWLRYPPTRAKDKSRDS